jgi:ferric-dicitrate binding protein FerR (iron transport regulator)
MSSPTVREDEQLQKLVDLAKGTIGDAMTAQERQGFSRLEQKLAEKPASARRSWAVGTALAAAAAIAVVVGVARREHPLSINVLNGTVSDAGYLRASEGAQALVQFSDGSEVRFDNGARTRVGELTAHGARFMIESGTAHVHVMPLPGAKWSVEAGPYTIVVTGTEFEVGWAMFDEVLDVHLRKGSVIVKGPLTGEGLRMASGQHLTADIKEARVVINEERDTASLPAGPSPDAVSAAEAPAVHDEAQDAPPETAGPGRGAAPHVVRGVEETTLGWSALVGQGDFASVLTDAERRGLSTVLSKASIDDLTALADAARYSRRPDIAKRALTAERSRFPRSRQARDAAFFLGGLADGEAAALEWYDRYLTDSPNGTYASQALGRKMMAVRHLQGEAAARVIAGDYMSRFPGGPYASSAQKLLKP